MNLYDIIDLLKIENVEIKSWIHHISEEIACPEFYKALNDKHPINVTKVSVNNYADLFNVCLLLDMTCQFPGFDRLLKDYDEIALCYTMTENQQVQILNKIAQISYHL